MGNVNNHEKTPLIDKSIRPNYRNFLILRSRYVKLDGLLASIADNIERDNKINKYYISSICIWDVAEPSNSIYQKIMKTSIFMHNYVIFDRDVRQSFIECDMLCMISSLYYSTTLIDVVVKNSDNVLDYEVVELASKHDINHKQVLTLQDIRNIIIG